MLPLSCVLNPITTQCLQQQNRHHYANYIQFPDDTCQSYFHKLNNKTMDLH